MRSIFLSPHNDDETLFGCFTLLRHQPLVVVCFRNDRMAQPSYCPGAPLVTFEEREKETERAMLSLGVRWRQWPILDSYTDPEILEGFMQGLLDPIGMEDPEVVFAPAFELAGNEQHNIVAEVAKEVFSEDVIQSYLTYTSAGRSTWGREVMVEPEWIARKHRALSYYESQASHPMTAEHFLGDIREYVA